MSHVFMNREFTETYEAKRNFIKIMILFCNILSKARMTS
jgi:hypothetical protein